MIFFTSANFTSAKMRTFAASLGMSAAALCAASSAANAQAAYWWAPSPGYGYIPPRPIYQPAPPRYMHGPIYPQEVYAPAPRAHPLNAAQVRSLLNERGLRVTAAPTRNGGVYVADVRDRQGNERRLIIDGYYGRVLQTFPGGIARQARPVPGPQYAGRPLDPEIDPDIVSPGNPVVIPGIGPGGSLERNEIRPPRAVQKKKPAKKVAARPPAVKIAPATLPLTPPPAAAIAPPVQETPPPANAALPAPVEQIPQPGPAAPASALPGSASPATPSNAATPVAGQPAAAEPPQTAKEAEQPAERPRRRVRFLKPDAPATADVTQPGNQLVPIPEPPPVVLSPRTATAPAPAMPAVPGDASPPAGSNTLE